MIQKSSRHYFLAIKNKIQIIILFTVLFALAGSAIGAYNRTKKAPNYIASVTILAGGPKAYINENGIDYEKYEKINKNSVNLLNNIVNSEVMMDKIIDKFQLDTSYDKFQKKMQAKVVDNTDMLILKVKAQSPDLAREIVNEIIAISMKKSREIDDIANIEVVEDIRVEEMPVKSKGMTDLRFFGVLGCALSLFLIIILEYLDDTVEFPEDIEENVGLPILGIISENAQAPEAYRVLRTNIHNFRTEPIKQTILVTSSDRNENKSKVTTNLAMSMAQIQKKVLLVDGNIREPEIHTFFNLDNETGLSNILKYDLDYREVIQKAEEKNLDVLTSGPRLSNPAELLLSDKLETLFEEMKKEYDTIIINSYFLGSMPDTMFFSTFVDGVILVSTVGESNIDDMNKAKKLLQKLNAQILGVTLNE